MPRGRSPVERPRKHPLPSPQSVPPPGFLCHPAPLSCPPRPRGHPPSPQPPLSLRKAAPTVRVKLALRGDRRVQHRSWGSDRRRGAHAPLRLVRRVRAGPGPCDPRDAVVRAGLGRRVPLAFTVCAQRLAHAACRSAFRASSRCIKSTVSGGLMGSHQVNERIIKSQGLRSF